MSIQITIRNVSEKTRDELAARAALQGKSMQEYLRAELERMASRPSVETWLEQVRKRKRASRTAYRPPGYSKRVTLSDIGRTARQGETRQLQLSDSARQLTEGARRVHPLMQNANYHVRSTRLPRDSA